MKLYMFRAVPQPIIIIHCTLGTGMSCRFEDSFRAGPGWNWFPSWSYSKAVYKPVWHIPVPSVRWINSVPSWSYTKAIYKPVWHIPVPNVQWINSWWWIEELSETCRVSCQNNFVKLVHLVGFIIKKVTDISKARGAFIFKINYQSTQRNTSTYETSAWHNKSGVFAPFSLSRNT